MRKWKRRAREEQSREDRLRRIKKLENRMLGLATAMCVSMGAAGWIYKHNNTVPDLIVPQTPMPARNGHGLLVSADEQSVQPPQQPRMDASLDYTGGRSTLKLDSLEYEWRYPLARQLKYLESNAEALRLLRRGLALPYVQPPLGDERWSPRFRMYGLRELLILEARVRARRHDWNGAAQSLEDTLHLGYAIPHGGAVDAWAYGAHIRKMARAEFDWLLPHLSGEQLRRLALQLEEMHRARVEMPQALEEEKRSNQRFLLHLMRIGDLRVLYGHSNPDIEPLKPFEKPPPPPPLEQIIAQNLPEFDRLPRLLQLQLAWVSKPSILSEHTRCLDWQIAQARLPYLLRAKQWPFPKRAEGQMISDALCYTTYPQFSYEVRDAHKTEALDEFTFVGLALRAFRAEHKYLPRRLQDLVPRYLARVPLDPFDPSRELGYKPQPIHASWSERRERLVQPPPPVVVTPRGLATPTPFPGSVWIPPPGLPTPTPAIIAQGPPALLSTNGPHGAPSEGPPPGAGPPQLAPSDETWLKVTHPLGAPWTLWSIGPDGRDNNGLPFRYTQGHETSNRQFSTDRMYMDDTAQSDIVAGINH